jgi:lysine 6-dehydrogenase
MRRRYAVLGAGMQGAAAAYDLARFGEPEALILADVSWEQATKAAQKVDALVGKSVCEPCLADATDPDSLRELLKKADVILSCLPYWLHPAVARVCVEQGVHMVDLGGHTGMTLETLKLDEKAKARGISIVPDTGLAPGLVNSIGNYFLETFDSVESIRLYCGVLPQNPVPPLNYMLTFNVEGLVNEYDHEALVLRGGEIAWVETLGEWEEIEVESLGKLEAFTTSGGTSTAPYSHQGKVREYEYKTIRYPGHCEIMRTFRSLGFWSEDDSPGGCPRNVFCRVLQSALLRIQDRDLCIVRGVGVGQKQGRPAKAMVEILDHQCEVTGLTSMERLTGFSISIHAIEAAYGRLPKGAIPYEKAMAGTSFLDAIQRRGIGIRFSDGS